MLRLEMEELPDARHGTFSKTERAGQPPQTARHSPRFGSPRAKRGAVREFNSGSRRLIGDAAYLELYSAN